jgi:ATP-binding cassette subfamily B protein
MYANGKISFSDLAVSISILIMFSAQIWDLVGMVGNLSRDMGVLKQNYNYIFNGINIVEEYYQKEDSSLSLENIKFNNVLEVKGLNFAYPDRPEVQALTNIDLVIKKNEKIGIVGRSGSGKSTLVKLLLGFYEYEEGSFLVDGRSISRSQIATLNSYVPQDTSLFQESIEYNIKYGQKREIGIEEVKEAAKKAHADEFIDKLKDGYKTNIGERGVKLSLGQRQRIAIARAFLNKNDLLILDEATSALDSKTEKLVQESLEQLWDSKTVIAIAHRLSTLNNVDRIVVMDKGRIVEVGTKTELLASKGIFAELWKHQKDGLLIED